MVNAPNPFPILYLHHTGHFSGAENSLLHLVTHLDKEKFSPIFLIQGEGDFPLRLMENGVKLIPHEFGKTKKVHKLIDS